ncbi:MAG: Maf family nucleotide pyrophosphatase [Alloprevotella sp.]
MLDNLSKYQIVLASTSPRRKDLLQRLGLNFKVRTLFGVDESYPEGLSPLDIVRHISRKKAEAYATSMAQDELLIAADTIVCFDGHVLGKPKDVAEAKAMLGALSERTHEVVTGVTVITAARKETFAVSTEVKFAKISQEDIEFYVENYLPFDKAGAYGIQEWIGMIAVEEIRGSFFNVVGLPVQRLFQVLKTF